jgi:hypothetical protein
MGLQQPAGLGILQNQPADLNFLSTHRFQVVIWRAPAVQYFAQECNLPGIAMGNAVQPNPFVDLPIPGDKVHFEDFNMTFPVDEQMQNYREIATWIIGLGFPRSYGQYAEIAQSQIGIKSDIGFMIMDSQFNPKHFVTFFDAFPTALSGINFDTKVADTTIPLATATFKYAFYQFDNVNTPSTIVTPADLQFGN